MINYNNKKFRAIVNSKNGDVDNNTVFHYWQEGDTVWGTYKNKDIRFGTLLAKVKRSGELDMRYQHLDQNGSFKGGTCISTPEILEDGRIRLHEKWQWTTGDQSSGTSTIEEVRL